MVGCGKIAGGFDGLSTSKFPITHAAGFIKHGGFELSSCIEPDIEARSSFINKWALNCEAYASFENLPENKHFDVISICSPTKLHYDHVFKAIKYGPKIIFCEKPLAESTKEANELIDLCRGKNILLIVNYSRRWDPSVIELKEKIIAGEVGAVRSVVGVYSKGLLNNGSHLIDLFIYLLGDIKFSHRGVSICDGQNEDPSIVALLRDATGKIPIYLNIGNSLDYSHLEVEITTESGVIRMENGGLRWNFRSIIGSPIFAGYKVLDVSKPIPGRYLESMAMAVGEIYDYLRFGKEMRVKDSDALEALRICEAIKASAN